MKKKFLALTLALSLALTLASCGAGSPSAEAASQKEVDLTEFYNTLLEENEWPGLMPLDDQELLDGFYPGLSEIPAKQCLVNTAAISATVGEIALVETEKEEDVEKVADIFQARIDYQVGDENNPGGAWYPMTIEGWENNSRIVSQGNYVMLAVGDYADQAVESFNGLFA